MIDAINILIFLPLIALINVCIYKLISTGIGNHRYRSLSIHARQLYLYIICGVGLSMLVNGLEQSLINLTNILISDSLVRTSSDGAALGISLLIIGGPLWIFYWLKINREVSANPKELSSGIRNAYFLLVLAVSLAISVNCSSEIFFGIIRESEFNWNQITTLSIWLLVWIFHTKVLIQTRPFDNTHNQSLNNTFVYSFSLVGLFLLAANSGSLVYMAIYRLVQNKNNSHEILFSDTNFGTLNLAVVVGLGFVIWFTHWSILRNKLTKREYESIYLYLIFIVTTITIMVSSIALMMTMFDLAFQTKTTDEWILTFFSPLVTVAIAISVLLFHLKSFQNAYLITTLPKTSNEILIFSLAFLSLGILSSGFSILIHSVMISIIQIGWTELIQPTEFWKGPLSLGISMTMVGGLVWYLSWSRLGSVSLGFKKNLRYSRIYFLAVIGTAIVFTAGTLAALIFTFIKGLLANNIGLQTIESLVTPLSIGVVLLGAGVYHLRIFRHLPLHCHPENKIELHKEEPSVKTITIISETSNDSLIDALQMRLGYSAKEIIWMVKSDINRTRIQPNLDDLYNSIIASNDPDLLLIQDGDDYRMYPYEKKSLEG